VRGPPVGAPVPRRLGCGRPSTQVQEAGSAAVEGYTFSARIGSYMGWRHPGTIEPQGRTPKQKKMVYHSSMSRTNVEIDDGLIRQARKLTGLTTKRKIVQEALESLVRAERRKGILRYYGSGIWKGDLRRLRRSRV